MTVAEAGNQLPDFELISGDGQRVAFGELLGPANIVFFWATWCAYCRRELVELQQVARDFWDTELRVLTVNLDETGRSIALFLRNLGVDLPVYTLTAAADRILSVDAVPLTLLTDKKGRVVHNFVGFNPKEMEKLLFLAQELLGEIDGGAPPEGE